MAREIKLPWTKKQQDILFKIIKGCFFIGGIVLLIISFFVQNNKIYYNSNTDFKMLILIAMTFGFISVITLIGQIIVWIASADIKFKYKGDKS